MQSGIHGEMEKYTKYQIESNISAAHGIVRSKGHILNFNIYCPHFHISYNLQCKMPAPMLSQLHYIYQTNPSADVI